MQIELPVVLAALALMAALAFSFWMHVRLVSAQRKRIEYLVEYETGLRYLLELSQQREDQAREAHLAALAKHGEDLDDLLAKLRKVEAAYRGESELQAEQEAI